MSWTPPAHADVLSSLPRDLPPDAAVDPIDLTPVDSVRVTVLMDNSYDGLLPAAPGVDRAGLERVGGVPSRIFELGTTSPGLRAEHGFSTLVTAERNGISTRILFDFGVSPDGMVTNADRLGVDLDEISAIVVSHGHFDHVGGLDGMLNRRPRSGLPIVLHPGVWTRRRLSVPGSAIELPTLSRHALEAEGLQVIERRVPSLIAGGGILITGEVDRTTDYERGMPPPHQAWRGSEWHHDSTVIDDQALVINVRGHGLVIVTGCGHAGVVNIARHAARLTGVGDIAAIIGGFHLSGSAFEPAVGPTVSALAQMSPTVLAPGHCTGWHAHMALAEAMPDAWVPSASGTTYAIGGV